MTASSAPAPTSTCSPRARTPSRSTSASTPTRPTSRSSTPCNTAASAFSPPATEPPPAAGPRWPCRRTGRNRHVSLKLDDNSRTAELTVRGPADAQRVEDAAFWPLRMARELDHALLRLRFDAENIGLVIVRTEGDRKIAQQMGELLATAN